MKMNNLSQMVFRVIMIFTMFFLILEPYMLLLLLLILVVFGVEILKFFLVLFVVTEVIMVNVLLQNQNIVIMVL